jgi:hypothetical protein
MICDKSLPTTHAQSCAWTTRPGDGQQNNARNHYHNGEAPGTNSRNRGGQGTRLHCNIPPPPLRHPAIGGCVILLFSLSTPPPPVKTNDEVILLSPASPPPIANRTKKKVNCPFYFKIGACRHADRCSRIHHRPAFSQTILIKHVYRHPIREAELSAAKEGRSVDGVIVDEDAAREAFLVFFE